ncbi:hypothetical protein B0J13DRAFT_525182 [Dactylonectria estremocensis]|uniref:Uncharacterized protein n=1 Tax=Dactylonectria estremocensis TaxID=1079267 RepID=A0A9P9ERH0_9HYPO|nr:hypothetical protein B0J13DRAFT_525182 [Dactylonectria estremocensis]
MTKTGIGMPLLVGPGRRCRKSNVCNEFPRTYPGAWGRWICAQPTTQLITISPQVSLEEEELNLTEPGSWCCRIKCCRSKAAATEKRAADAHYACSLPISYSKDATSTTCPPPSSSLPPALPTACLRGQAPHTALMHNQFEARGPRPLPEAILGHPSCKGVRIRAERSSPRESSDFAGSEVFWGGSFVKRECRLKVPRLISDRYSRLRQRLKSTFAKGPKAQTSRGPSPRPGNARTRNWDADDWLRRGQRRVAAGFEWQVSDCGTSELGKGGQGGQGVQGGQGGPQALGALGALDHH